jgi:hypothetical protein
MGMMLMMMRLMRGLCMIVAMLVRRGRWASIIGRGVCFRWQHVGETNQDAIFNIGVFDG